MSINRHFYDYEYIDHGLADNIADVMRWHTPSVREMLKQWIDAVGITSDPIELYPPVNDLRTSAEILSDPETEFTELPLSGGHITSADGKDRIIEKAYTTGNNDLIVKFDDGKYCHYTGLIPTSFISRSEEEETNNDTI